jgi:hypothetical protein
MNIKPNTKYNEETKETTYTEIDFLKQEIENELENALSLIEDAQEKLDRITQAEHTNENIYNNNELTTIILKLKTMLDK